MSCFVHVLHMYVSFHLPIYSPLFSLFQQSHDRRASRTTLWLTSFLEIKQEQNWPRILGRLAPQTKTALSRRFRSTRKNQRRPWLWRSLPQTSSKHPTVARRWTRKRMVKHPIVSRQRMQSRRLTTQCLTVLDPLEPPWFWAPSRGKEHAQRLRLRRRQLRIQPRTRSPRPPKQRPSRSQRFASRRRRQSPRPRPTRKLRSPQPKNSEESRKEAVWQGRRQSWWTQKLWLGHVRGWLAKEPSLCLSLSCCLSSCSLSCCLLCFWPLVQHVAHFILVSKAYSCGWKLGKQKHPGKKEKMATVWWKCGQEAKKNSAWRSSKKLG